MLLPITANDRPQIQYRKVNTSNTAYLLPYNGEKKCYYRCLHIFPLRCHATKLKVNLLWNLNTRKVYLTFYQLMEILWTADVLCLQRQKIYWLKKVVPRTGPFILCEQPFMTITVKQVITSYYHRFFEVTELNWIKSCFLSYFKGHAQFIFSCNPQKSSVNVGLVKKLKSTDTKKGNCEFL